MKTKIIATLAACCCAASVCPAQTFDSGSNGSMGAFNPTVSTNVQIPPDGIFHFTTVNIPRDIGVNLIRNALNTPVYILAQGNVVISHPLYVTGGGGIGSNPGRGGPGGFDGGFGSVQGLAASDGQGPGGGKVTGGGPGAAFAAPSGGNTNVYGNTLLSPLVGGSGGAGIGTVGGGGGGGAILIASSTRITINGYHPGGNFSPSISASGGNGDGAGAGGGSGGAIRLVAPIVDGVGMVATAGASGNYAGTQGRIRIDTLDRFAWRSLVFNGKTTVGSQMYVFPPNNPRLDIVEAAGQAIAAGITSAVQISLPPLTPTNQTIKVQATGFTTNVPVTVAVAPEAGPTVRYDGEIAVSSTNATIGTINVIIPAASFCNISVWTR